MSKNIDLDLKAKPTDELIRGIAQDLKVPDPINIIAKSEASVNENSKKHDGRASGVYHIQDLFEIGN
jgi:hypothetical protein